MKGLTWKLMWLARIRFGNHRVIVLGACGLQVSTYGSCRSILRLSGFGPFKEAIAFYRDFLGGRNQKLLDGWTYKELWLFHAKKTIKS